MVLESIIPEDAGRLRMACQLLAEIDPAQIDKVIDTLNTATTIGPMMDPTAYQDGRRFDNARNIVELMNKVKPVVVLLRSIKLNHD